MSSLVRNTREEHNICAFNGRVKTSETNAVQRILRIECYREMCITSFLLHTNDTGAKMHELTENMGLDNLWSAKIRTTVCLGLLVFKATVVDFGPFRLEIVSDICRKVHLLWSHLGSSFDLLNAEPKQASAKKARQRHRFANRCISAWKNCLQYMREFLQTDSHMTSLWLCSDFQYCVKYRFISRPCKRCNKTFTSSFSGLIKRKNESTHLWTAKRPIFHLQHNILAGRLSSILMHWQGFSAAKRPT